MLEELRSLVESTSAKYADLAKDQQVQDGVASLARALKSKLNVGPSPQFRDAVQQVKQFENNLDTPSSMFAAKAKATAKKKSRLKSAG